VSDRLLSVKGVKMRFYGVNALDGVDFAVQRGELLGLIGPNGSGKSTCFNCLSGVLRASDGEIVFAGADISKSPPSEVFRRGIGRTFQLPEICPEMTVLENLLLAIQETRGTLWSRLWRHREDEELERAHEVLELLNLEVVAAQPAGRISYGQQKLCDLGMALMPSPDLVLLDEPMAGVNPALIDELIEHITALNRAGTTFVIIEHNLKVITTLCQRVLVLDHGKLISEGTPSEVQQDERVLAAYFGA